MRGFLKPKNVIDWFGVLIKAHINSDPILGPRFKMKKITKTKTVKKHPHIHKKQQQNNDGLFPAEWLQHIEGYYEI